MGGWVPTVSRAWHFEACSVAATLAPTAPSALIFVDHALSKHSITSFNCACGPCVSRSPSLLAVQAVKEKVVNFAMFKAIFAAAVLGDQVYEEVFVWVTWFSVVGLLNVVSLVCRLRLDAVSVRELGLGTRPFPMKRRAPCMRA